MPTASVSLPPSSDSSSRSLVNRLKARDPEGWRRFTLVYGPLVYGWGRRAGLQDNDAADLGQEVFQAVARGIDGFRRDRPDDTFRGWLWTITRNKVREHFRRQADQPRAEGGSASLDRLRQVEAEEDPPLEDSDATALAHRAIALIQGDFAETTWQAFWRTAVDGQAPANVAADLGLSVAAVYMARSRVLARLREELADPLM
jgi:RNA polymerase sigma-70 factor, ECF subfamily